MLRNPLDVFVAPYDSQKIGVTVFQDHFDAEREERRGQAGGDGLDVAQCDLPADFIGPDQPAGQKNHPRGVFVRAGWEKVVE